MSKPRKEDELLDSSYDGIEEYDNDLPKWWLWLFYITIIISPIYVWYWHMGPGLLPPQQVEVDMQELQAIRAKYAAASSGGVMSEGDLLKFVADGANVSAGATHYQEKCLPCHGAKGEGLIGPNLTDAQWIHGGGVLDIQRVIREGVVAKGMVAWKEVMNSTEINQTVAFLWSIRNTNIPGKAPEGETVS